jgi:hypothetical protein
MILARLKTWALALLALVAAIATAGLYGRRKGKQAAEQAEAAQAAQDTIHAHEVRDEVEAEVSKLPDAPAQAVGDADPTTAAGKLRDNGWMRD